MADPKSEFENVTGGYVGVQVKGPDGRMRGIAVAPKSSVWLDEDEQIATANAPRRDADNPFTNGELELRTEATKIANRRPIGFTEEPQVHEVQSGGAGEGEAAEEPQEAQGEGDAAGDGGGEDSTAVESEEPEQPKAEEPKPETAKEPARTLTREEQEKNARAAAGRRRPPAANETGAAPPPTGKAPQGKRAPGEEVGTPEAAAKA